MAFYVLNSEHIMAGIKTKQTKPKRTRKEYEAIEQIEHYAVILLIEQLFQF
jgi:hypothetical protein